MEKRCPLDRKELKESDLILNKAIKRIIDDCEVHCLSTIENSNYSPTTDDSCCKWIGKLDELDNHFLKCPHAIIKCPNFGCQSSFQRRHLETHIELCPCNIQGCIFCGSQQLASKISNHLLECDYRPVQCPNKCYNNEQDGITTLCAYAMDIHRHVCPLEIIACKYAEIGCTIHLPRKDMDIHSKDIASHIDSFTEHIRVQKDEISRLKEVLHEKDEEIYKLRNIVIKQEDGTIE